VPSVVRNLPLLLVCDGNVPSKVMVLLMIVPSVIHALLAALRFFHSGLTPPVSIQSWNATVTVGAVAPLLSLNNAARLLFMSARTVGNESF
jgi:hypothetical protein